MLNDVDYEKYGTAGQQKGLLEDDASIEEPSKSLCSNFLKYYVLLCTSLIAFLQGWIWNTYGPISITVEKEDVFGWNDSIVAFLGNWGPIAYVVAFYPTAVLLDAYGLRTSSLAAMLLIFLSCAIRLAITDSSVECLVLQHIGQALNGLAGPYAMSAGTTISSTFFPAQLRTISTSIFVIANMAGVSLSYILGPIMVPADGSINDVRDYLWVAFIMASVCMVMIFIYLPDKPDDAPSVSSTMKRTYNLEGFYKLALNKPFVLLAISYGIMTGVYAGWGPLYCLIMQKIPRNIVKSPQVTASWIGFYSNVSGNISGLLFSFLSDMRMGKSKNKNNGGNINIKRNILMLISLSATLLYVAFSVVVIVPGLLESVGIQGIYILCIAGGILINGTPPLFFELSVDVVFPIAEGLTTTLLTLVNNVGGLVFLLLPSIGIEIQPTWIVLATAGSCLVAFLCLACGNDEYKLKRTMVDEVNF